MLSIAPRRNSAVDGARPRGQARRVGPADASHAGRWRRDRIRDWVGAHCWSDAKQSYLLHPGADRLALTRDAVRRELCPAPPVFRHSGMEAEEGTSLACAFWLVEAFALFGEQDSAVQQMDPGTGAMLGNMPQALSHLALVHAALAVDEGAG